MQPEDKDTDQLPLVTDSSIQDMDYPSPLEAAKELQSRPSLLEADSPQHKKHKKKKKKRHLDSSDVLLDLSSDVTLPPFRSVDEQISENATSERKRKHSSTSIASSPKKYIKQEEKHNSQYITTVEMDSPANEECDGVFGQKEKKKKKKKKMKKERDDTDCDATVQDGATGEPEQTDEQENQSSLEQKSEIIIDNLNQPFHETQTEHQHTDSPKKKKKSKRNKKSSEFELSLLPIPTNGSIKDETITSSSEAAEEAKSHSLFLEADVSKHKKHKKKKKKRQLDSSDVSTDVSCHVTVSSPDGHGSENKSKRKHSSPSGENNFEELSLSPKKKKKQEKKHRLQDHDDVTSVEMSAPPNEVCDSVSILQDNVQRLKEKKKKKKKKKKKRKHSTRDDPDSDATAQDIVATAEDTVATVQDIVAEEPEQISEEISLSSVDQALEVIFDSLDRGGQTEVIFDSLDRGRQTEYQHSQSPRKKKKSQNNRYPAFEVTGADSVIGERIPDDCSDTNDTDVNHRQTANIPTTENGETASTCYICEELVSSREAYIAHLAQNHNKLSYSCPKCRKLMSSQKLLTCHMKISCEFKHRENMVAPYRCKLCPLTYSFRKGLLRHEQREHGKGRQTSHHCVHCKRQFTTSFRAKQHAEKCAEGHANRAPTQGTIECKECGKFYSSAQSLYYHVRTIHKHHVFACVCGKKFLGSIYYYSHQKKCQKAVD